MISYSAIFGGYDRPRSAPAGDSVLFTDRAVDPHLGWDARIVAPPFPDNLARSNRAYKLQPHAHFDTDRVLYLDGSMRLRVSPEDVLDMFRSHAGRDYDVFTLRHSLGHLASDEAVWVRSKSITRSTVLREQTERYRALGMPGSLPGAEPRLIVARLNDATRGFFNLWWHEVRSYSHRDQVSFPFAAWRSEVDVHLVPFATGRALFDHKPHARPQLRLAS